MTFGSLFSGIGGLDLGLERAGMECKWQVEIDDYCTKVLEKHWPNVWRWRDIKTFAQHPYWEGGGGELSGGLVVDLIAGGFPCQDVSNAGKRVGITGERSGLWVEFHRIICALRPRFVLVENVAALLGRGFSRVLSDLAACGYDAEWDCLPCGAFGAHFLRDRVFIFAQSAVPRLSGSQRCWPRPTGTWSQQQFEGLLRNQIQLALPAGRNGRISVGVAARMDRLRTLGNVVVPDVAEWIGRRIIEAEGGV